MHTGKGRSIAEALGRSTGYVENPDKTNGGDLITAYECDPIIADVEFLFSKRQYAQITGRDQKDKDIIAYHLRQAFKPGEIDPATANKIGYELALSLTKGKHAFLVCTHVDKQHIHSHIIFNSTSLDYTRKFRNFKNSSFAIRKISDQLCLENGLSVIEKPKPSRGHYGKWQNDSKLPTARDKLREMIDISLSANMTFDEFVGKMKAAGCEVKFGKHLAFKASGQQRFIRCDSLGDDYSENAIRERLDGKRTVKPKQKTTMTAMTDASPKINLLIDIQNNIKAKDSPGYEQWCKVFNLKQAAQTLIFLQENNLLQYEDLSSKAQQAKDDFNIISNRIHVIDDRLKAITTLQKHIGAYSKTRDVYVEYRKSGYNKKFLAEHEGDIILNKAAKKHFEELGLQKLPTVKMLQTEYANLLAEKKKLYSRYYPARDFMQKILIAKQNTEQLLNYKDVHQYKKNERSER